MNALLVWVGVFLAMIGAGFIGLFSYWWLAAWWDHRELLHEIARLKAEANERAKPE